MTSVEPVREFVKIPLPPVALTLPAKLMLPAFIRTMLAPPVVMLYAGGVAPLPDAGAGNETDEVWFMLTKIVSAGLVASDALILMPDVATVGATIASFANM